MMYSGEGICDERNYVSLYCRQLGMACDLQVRWLVSSRSSAASVIYPAFPMKTMWSSRRDPQSSTSPRIQTLVPLIRYVNSNVPAASIAYDDALSGVDGT